MFSFTRANKPFVFLYFLSIKGPLGQRGNNLLFKILINDIEIVLKLNSRSLVLYCCGFVGFPG